MKLIFFSGLLLLALGHCTTKTTLAPPEATDPLTIRTGTSFGMCAGYCQRDYTLSGTTLTLTQTGTRTRNQTPVKTCQTTISPAQWADLKAATNFDTFSTKPATLGCPDCADGGAEYVELQTGDRKHRVTIEFGKTIPGFEPLVDALRKQRAEFPDCP